MKNVSIGITCTLLWLNAIAMQVLNTNNRKPGAIHFAALSNVWNYQETFIYNWAKKQLILTIAAFVQAGEETWNHSNYGTSILYGQ